jgi:FkbM family methyltransferase
MGEELPYLSRAVSASGKVIAVEAHPFTYEGLLQTISLNRLANCEPVSAAVSDQTGTTQMSDLPDRDANSIVRGTAGEAQIQVAAFTLDDLAEQMCIGRIDLLKMNIEGAERLAIRGMRDALQRTRHVVISCHDFLAAEIGDESLRTKELIIRALASAGFKVETREHRHQFIADYVYGTRDR